MFLIIAFLKTFAVNKCSLEIDYKQFIYIHPNIAIWLADAPHSVLEVMEEVANKVVFDLHPNYRQIHKIIYVRITNLPVYDQIRNIRCNMVARIEFTVPLTFVKTEVMFHSSFAGRSTLTP